MVRSLAIFAEAEDALTRAQSAAVSAFLSKNALKPSDIGVVGFHGQTMLHRAPTPARLGQTRQLGDGALMARLVGTNVAYDFRTADMAAGGQGAPLAASYHVALLRRLGSDRKAAVLNLGGVSNITWWDGDAMVAFDTGPANAPLNDWVRQHGLGDMDRDGVLGAKGKVHEERLARLLTHPYLSAPSPKSLDRNDFTAAMAEGLSAEDGAATLTAFTAGAVGKALDILPTRPERLILCGGGRRNPTLVAAIRERAKVEPVLAEAVGWRGDAVEAECFAFLAVRTLRGLPISFPRTTGVQRAHGRRPAGALSGRDLRRWAFFAHEERIGIMALELYFHPFASFCQKALIAFYENDTPFERHVVDLGDDASRAGLNKLWPITKFPVLRDHARQQTIPELSIIVEYLTQYYPGPSRLIPDDPELAIETRFWDRYFDLYVHEPMQKIVGDRLRPAEKKDSFGVDAARRLLTTAYGMIDDRMSARTWAVGPSFTLADCAAAPALFYAAKVQPFGQHTNVAAYLDRLQERKSYARVLAEAAPYSSLFPSE